MTIIVGVTLQVTPSVMITRQHGIALRFDRVGYAVYLLDSVAVPLGLGCLGPLFRRDRGLGVCIVSGPAVLLITI